MVFDSLPGDPRLATLADAARMKQDVEARLLYAAYDRLRLSLALSVIAAVLAVSLLSSLLPTMLLAMWAGVIVVIAAARLLLWAAFQRAAPAEHALARWQHLFLAGTIAASAAWSIGPTLMIPEAGGVELAILVGTLLSVCAVGASSLAPQQATMHAYFVVALAPPAIAVWLTGRSDAERAVALMIVAGLVSVIISGRRASQAMRETLEARYHLGAAVSNAAASRAALQQSEERFRTLVEWSPEPTGVHRGGKFIYVNPAAITLFAAGSALDLVGKPILDIVHPDFHQIVLSRLQELTSRGLGARFDDVRCIKFLRLDGTATDVELQSTLIFYDGEPAIQTIAHDVTDKIQAESARASLEIQLRESQKMEAIGTLAGGIAHDFNNILATILGNTELARDDVGTNAAALESLDEIKKAASRARDLVQQILSFSRRQPTEKKLTMLAPIIEESVRLLRATLPARVTLEVHCDADVPLVMADATQIEQVVINLATNAMQAMHDESGRIGIRLDTVTLNAAWADAHPALQAMHDRHPATTVRLTVSDDGLGMDAATLGRIFEPFFTTKPVDEGTGLGLSVVHGIVQGHEGAITVDSQPDKGTTFTLFLPMAEAQAGVLIERKKVAAATPLLSADAAPHILYIDDDESLMFLVKRLMERRGYRVSGYIEQREALDQLRANPAAFDLVVTDYNMPGMSGLDVAREVRAIRSDLPVAITSGFIDESLREQAQSTGVLELIFKASEVDEFCDAFVRLAATIAERRVAGGASE